MFTGPRTGPQMGSRTGSRTRPDAKSGNPWRVDLYSSPQLSKIRCPRIYTPSGILSAINWRCLLVSPSTTNVPSPLAWNVRRSCRFLSIQACTPCNRKMPGSSRYPVTRHSRQARHSATNGAPTFRAGNGVNSNVLNLSTSFPEQSPIRITRSAISTVGTAGTHSRVCVKAWNEWFQGPVVNASCGVKSVTMCHEIVIRLFFSPSFVATRMTGPGSNSMKAFFNGNSLNTKTTTLRLFVCIVSSPNPTTPSRLRLAQVVFGNNGRK